VIKEDDEEVCSCCCMSGLPNMLLLIEAGRLVACLDIPTCL